MIVFFLLALAVFFGGSWLYLSSQTPPRSVYPARNLRERFVRFCRRVGFTIGFAVFALIAVRFSYEGAVYGLFGLGIFRALVGAHNLDVRRFKRRYV